MIKLKSKICQTAKWCSKAATCDQEYATYRPSVPSCPSSRPSVCPVVRRIVVRPVNVAQHTSTGIKNNYYLIDVA